MHNFCVFCVQFEMEIKNISVLVEQEVTTPPLRTFPAIALLMGKYSSVALFVRVQDWSSKVRKTTCSINTCTHIHVIKT